MKRVFLFLCMIVCIFSFNLQAFADTISNDMVSLEFTATKIWYSGNDLCMTGSFSNTRGDWMITKIVEFDPNVVFTKDNGEKEELHAKPIKFPMCKIEGYGSKKVTFNFGPLEHKWKSWVAKPNYTYQYREN